VNRKKNWKKNENASAQSRPTTHTLHEITRGGDSSKKFSSEPSVQDRGGEKKLGTKTLGEASDTRLAQLLGSRAEWEDQLLLQSYLSLCENKTILQEDGGLQQREPPGRINMPNWVNRTLTRGNGRGETRAL